MNPIGVSLENNKAPCSQDFLNINDFQKEIFKSFKNIINK